MIKDKLLEVCIPVLTPLSMMRHNRTRCGGGDATTSAVTWAMGFTQTAWEEPEWGRTQCLLFVISCWTAWWETHRFTARQRIKTMTTFSMTVCVLLVVSCVLRVNPSAPVIIHARRCDDVLAHLLTMEMDVHFVFEEFTAGQGLSTQTTWLEEVCDPQRPTTASCWSSGWMTA